MSTAVRSYIFPIAAALATTGAVWIAGAAATVASAELATSLLLIAAPAPLVVPVLWACSLLMTGKPYWSAVAALAWLVAAMVMAPPLVWGPYLGYVLAGLAGGWALGRRWRWDAAIGVIILLLAPGLIWATVTVGLEDTLTELSLQLREAFVAGLPTAEDEASRLAARAELDRQLAATVKTATLIWPSTMVLGLIGQAVLIVLAIWVVLRIGGRQWIFRPLTSFLVWRLPFYWVWLLAAGLALIALRAGVWYQAGIKLVIVAGLMFSVQGLAVQAVVINRIWGPVMRVIFWIVAGFFLAPVLLLSGVVLGIADQWLNFRRLDQASDGHNA